MLTQTDDASNTLYSDRYQQTYHSTFGARTESMHVFLHGAGVRDRLNADQPTRVLEIGFGLGLNCLLCADCANHFKTTLAYTGIEHAPISAAAMHDLAYGQLLNEPALADHLESILSTVNGSKASVLGSLGNYTQLQLLINDATSAELLNEIGNDGGFDAIFLDAFSPEVNPECWTAAFFSSLASLLKPTGRLATYCVKGSVRRNLESVGFCIHKYPGPKGKREVLWASLSKDRINPQQPI